MLLLLLLLLFLLLLALLLLLLLLLFPLLLALLLLLLLKPYVLTFTCHCPPPTLPATPPWQLIRGQSNRQLIGGVSQRVNIELERSISLSPALCYIPGKWIRPFLP